MQRLPLRPLPVLLVITKLMRLATSLRAQVRSCVWGRLGQVLNKLTSSVCRRACSVAGERCSRQSVLSPSEIKSVRLSALILDFLV